MAEEVKINQFIRIWYNFHPIPHNYSINAILCILHELINSTINNTIENFNARHTEDIIQIVNEHLHNINIYITRYRTINNAIKHLKLELKNIKDAERFAMKTMQIIEKSQVDAVKYEMIRAESIARRINK